MNENQPDARSQMPPEMFTALEQGAVAIVEMFRSYRRAGASLVEASFIIGATLICGNRAGDDEQP